MAVNIAQVSEFQFNQNDLPLSGGKLFTYAAGTTTKLATYVDSTGLVPNANPIILDSNGQCSIWLTNGVLYKFTLSPATDTDPPTNPFWTQDNQSAALITGGTVTSVDVAAANGFYGTVANKSTSAIIALNTNVTGILKGNGAGVTPAANSDLPIMSATKGGAVPVPPNATNQWLRGDGSWSGALASTSDISANGVMVGWGLNSAAACTIVGVSALASNNNSAINNTAVGFRSLYANTTGQSNSAFGSYALTSNTIGLFNVAFGDGALQNNTLGNYNTAIGGGALIGNLGSASNVAVGWAALASNSAGSFNTAVGTAAGVGTGTYPNTIGVNNTFVGYQAEGASSSANNVITLGNGSITTLRCQVTSITALSDARDKNQINGLPFGIDFVMSLRPVTFTWNKRDGSKVGERASGFIAQDLQRSQDSFMASDLNLVYAENPEKLEATYGNLIPVLVKAIQDLKQEFDEYKLNHARGLV